MHDLIPTQALGRPPEQIGSLAITENPDVALASVAARLGYEAECSDRLIGLLGDVPDPGRGVIGDPFTGFWTGPDQWIISALAEPHENLAKTVKVALGASASVTEQSGAWVVFDLRGAALPDTMERLCPLPIRRMVAGDAHRVTIHQLGCFALRRESGDSLRIFGPRSSAASLHDALVATARAVPSARDQ